MTLTGRLGPLFLILVDVTLSIRCQSLSSVGELTMNNSLGKKV